MFGADIVKVNVNVIGNGPGKEGLNIKGTLTGGSSYEYVFTQSTEYEKAKTTFELGPKVRGVPLEPGNYQLKIDVEDHMQRIDSLSKASKTVYITVKPPPPPPTPAGPTPPGTPTPTPPPPTKVEQTLVDTTMDATKFSGALKDFFNCGYAFSVNSKICDTGTMKYSAGASIESTAEAARRAAKIKFALKVPHSLMSNAAVRAAVKSNNVANLIAALKKLKNAGHLPPGYKIPSAAAFKLMQAKFNVVNSSTSSDSGFPWWGILLIVLCVIIAIAAVVVIVMVVRARGSAGGGEVTVRGGGGGHVGVSTTEGHGEVTGTGIEMEGDVKVSVDVDTHAKI